VRANSLNGARRSTFAPLAPQARSRRFLFSDERRRHIRAAGPGMFLGDMSGELVRRDLNAARPAQGRTRGNVNPLHLPSSMGGSHPRVKAWLSVSNSR
jgi:hypothetical protein